MTSRMRLSVDIYAKRDDCNSGLASGGNKTGKLKYLLAEASERGADALVSSGGVQSNHSCQIWIEGVSLLLLSSSNLTPTLFMCPKAKLVQEHWVDDESSVYSKVGNIQLSRLMASLTAQVLSEGGKPYYIPAGASDHPLGGLGFARWAFEVYAQERELHGYWFKLLAETYHEDGEKLDRRKVIGIDASATPVETRS
ncbi:tryptophan synthase beta subunit-like PLP-dependent enzyme [Lentinula aff. lateritia]|uniref:Tryptophan synthase beta subunit-like PLP-dependent enzyme n=1 Tax=Lentinula aff. lateritia TaxID=2804960 RepID=A0ACC1TL19_9AGAR|nr:tryptophan synthase beta subunit-like PLP-dependent enzyme [Lentinula aff. lateritia]